MREFLAAVLTVIAMGVLVIAYSLSGSRVAAAPAGLAHYDPRVDPYQGARPVYVNDRVEIAGDPYAPYAVRTPNAYPVNAPRPAAAYTPYVSSAPAVRPARRVARSAEAEETSQVERRSGRNWKRTAMVVGGSTAAGAGVGAIIGGKKGALVGAALGGGASTLYEATKR